MKFCANVWLWSSLALLCASASLASPPEDRPKVPSLTYEVRSGDTLIGLAQAYLTNPSDYLHIQVLNAVDEPRRLQVGQAISVPIHLLRAEPVTAQIVNFQGQITLDTGSGPRSLAAHLAVSEGAVIATSSNAFVRLRLADGTHMVVPSNSRVRLTRLRRFLINGAMDNDIEVQKGRLESRVAPHRSPGGFRVTTPVSVTAVRGTNFRINLNAAADRASTEVLKGAVEVNRLNSTDQATDLTTALANQAVAVGASGLVRAALLPPPSLIAHDTVLSGRQSRVTFASQEGAARYRGRLALDAGMIDTLSEAETETGETELDLGNFYNGIYYLQVTAISDDGIEGRPTTYNLVRIANPRQQIGLQGLSDPRQRVYRFRWEDAMSGSDEASLDTGYRFVLHRLSLNGQPEGEPILDRFGLTQPHLSLMGLEDGVYSWRVQTIVEGSDGPHDVWSEPQTLHIGR